MKLSVIIPVYNSAKYLPACLDSLLGQDMEDYEAICVNDASTDESAAVLADYASRDERIRVFHQEHAGPGVARNLGLENAQGKYICFLDSDDRLLSETVLSFLLDAMEKEHLDILYYGTDILFENDEMRRLRSMEIPWFHRKKEYGLYARGQELFKDFVNNLDFVCNVWLQCLRRDFLLEEGIRFPCLRECEDEVFTFRSMLSAGTVRHANRSLYLRRVHPGSIMTSTFRFRNFRDGILSWRAMLEFLQERDFPIPVRDAILTHLSRRYLEIRRQYDDLPPEEQERLQELPAEEKECVEMFLLLRPCIQKMNSSFIFPYHLFKRGERVALYGAGSVGREFYGQVSRTGYVKIVGIVDRNAAKMKDGLPVRPVEDLTRMDYDSILIAVRDRPTTREIMAILEGMGIDVSRIRWDGDSYLVQDFYENVYFQNLKHFQDSLPEARKAL